MEIENPRHVLARYGLHPRRSLGQNFLVHPTAPGRIAAGAEIGPGDTVLEVGAGVGTLTAALAAQAGRVIAVETDPQLLPVLQAELGTRENVEIVPGDILELDPVDLLDVTPVESVPLWGEWRDNYLVVANLPYYITSAVIRHLLEARIRPARMVFTVQYEVARRMVAADGKMSILALSLYFYGKPQYLFRLKRGAFYPAPKVDSAVVRLDLYREPPLVLPGIEIFFQVVRAGFAQRRKQLRNTLASGLHLTPQVVEEAFAAIDVAHTRRAETLSLAEWEIVIQALYPLLYS
ncbi:MAG: 16S rRNA (adenine(1518)-N(6)/adenine(1519)-N(6))-dimethyltransferase RsmA [Chloroflexota bacterium]|nr:16S rRNA (adenine(1518)-N(6)/adenine(1519)-N(6))-dimethyltransferase RsmA [Chloroflexota bacterium]